MTDLHLEIRPVQVPEDFAGIAAVTNSISDWDLTVEDLQRSHRNHDPKYHWQRFVATILEGDQKRIVGIASVSHDDWAHEDGKYIVQISVDRDYQRRGIGSSLWETALNHLESLGDVRKLEAMIKSDEAGALHWLAHLGFKQVWERIESRLDPRSMDFAKYAALSAELEGQGIEIKTFDALPEKTRLQSLYDLDQELFQDVPMGLNLTPPPFERWQKDFLEDESNRFDAIWIAVKNDEWIGLSSLEIKPDFFCIGMTGVKKAFRGLGIAKRLKLEGVKYALDHGGFEIRTFNDHVNTAMLEMNFSMGFEKYRSHLRFEKLM
jgi:mycothiol synthase